MHSLFNLGKWPMMTSNRMWFINSSFKAIFEYSATNSHWEVIKYFFFSFFWVCKSLSMTSHKSGFPLSGKSWNVLEMKKKCPGMTWNRGKCPGKSWKLMNFMKLRFIVIGMMTVVPFLWNLKFPLTFLGKMFWKFTQKYPGKSWKWFHTFEWKPWKSLKMKRLNAMLASASYIIAQHYCMILEVWMAA